MAPCDEKKKNLLNNTYAQSARAEEYSNRVSAES